MIVKTIRGTIERHVRRVSEGAVILKSSAIVLAVVILSLYLTAAFSRPIARMFGVSSMEGGDSYFTLCCAMPVAALLSLGLGTVIAMWVDKR